MAETENQNTKQPATNVQPSKLYVYYYSDPDGATKDERCHAIYTDKPFDMVPWHMHKEAPDASLQDPVWDLNLNGGLGAWKENDATAQGQILAQAQEELTALKQKNADFDAQNSKLDQAVKTMQEAQTQSNQQTVAIMKSINEQSTNTSKMFGQMQTMMATLTQQIANMGSKPADGKATQPTQPTTPAQPTQSTQATDKK